MQTRGTIGAPPTNICVRTFVFFFFSGDLGLWVGTPEINGQIQLYLYLNVSADSYSLCHLHIYTFYAFFFFVVLLYLLSHFGQRLCQSRSTFKCCTIMRASLDRRPIKIMCGCSFLVQSPSKAELLLSNCHERNHDLEIKKIVNSQANVSDVSDWLLVWSFLPIHRSANIAKLSVIEEIFRQTFKMRWRNGIDTLKVAF